jgi:membrane associated rhomboid family serine protease
MQANYFRAAPANVPFGFWGRQGPQACASPEVLARAVAGDVAQQIRLVWTPESPYLVPPEQVPYLVKAVAVRKRATLRQRMGRAGMNGLIWGLFAAISLFGGGLSQILLFNLVALSVIPLGESLWELWRLRGYSREGMARDVPEARYRAWLATLRSPWTWFVMGCIGAVAAFQLLLGLRGSIGSAGVVKAAVRQGEVWRLLTGALLHGSLLHLLFNGSALFGLGKLVEVLGHRAYTTLVFVLSALAGSLFSLVLLPNGTSVGASGGIMGLLGFLVVLGISRRRQIPPAFVRSLLRSVAYMAGLGLLAWSVIDNAAHLGGLLAGAGLGAFATGLRA